MYSDPRTGNTVKQTIKGKRRYSRVIFGRKQNAHTLIRILRNSDKKNPVVRLINIRNKIISIGGSKIVRVPKNLFRYYDFVVVVPKFFSFKSVVVFVF